MPAVYLFSSHVRGEVVLDRIRYYIQTLQRKRDAMPSAANIKSISYLKSHAAQISEDLAANGAPFFITQNGEAKAVLQDVTSFEETQETLALLKLLALGNQDVAAGQLKPVADVVARLRAKRAMSVRILIRHAPGHGQLSTEGFEKAQIDVEADRNNAGLYI